MAVRRQNKAELVIEFIETYCKIPEGKDVGKPLKLAPFQKRFLKAVYNKKGNIRKAILSIAKKNGKTGLIACVLITSICGVLAYKNAQIISAAQSREQAALIFNAAVKMIQMNSELAERCHIVPSKKEIHGIFSGVVYKAISAEAKTAHGLSPRLIIIDELGQVIGANNDFIDALITAQGAYDDGLVIAISTQAASDADLLSLWIDHAKRTNEKDIISHVYEADKDCNLLDEKQWKKANPGLSTIRSIKDLKNSLVEASQIPSRESSCRNLLLNQRVSRDNLWIGASIWKENNHKTDITLLKNRPCCMGLDLSARFDLTAAVIAVPDDNDVIHLFPHTFTPVHGLKEKQNRDKAPYITWVENKQLIAVPGRVIDYEYVLKYLNKWCLEVGACVQSIEFDRWNIKEFKRLVYNYEFSQGLRMQEVGQGYKDFSPRCKAFLELLLKNKIAHGSHPLLNMAVSNAIAVEDPTEAIKLDKRKSTQRIDPLIAAVMACYPFTPGVKYKTDERIDQYMS